VGDECIDEVMVGMEQLRCGQRNGRAEMVWKRAQACVEEGTGMHGMCGCAWGCAVVDKGLGSVEKGAGSTGLLNGLVELTASELQLALITYKGYTNLV